jgi:hypothetical protein
MKSRKKLTHTTKKKPDGAIEVTLADGNLVMVDEADWPMLEKYTWVTRRGSRNKTLYVATRSADQPRRRYRLMHRLIMGAQRGQLVDHRDGNGLNNRRSNLRFATPQESACNQPKPRKDNSTGFRGVRPRKCGTWQAEIRVNKHLRYLGTFPSAIEAAKAYNYAAIALHGEFASLNKIPQTEESCNSN